MRKVKFRMIVAMANNRGIGYQNELPWKLRKEVKHFARLTTRTENPEKKNAILLGRRTWLSLPKEHQPLRNRINVVTSTQLKSEDIPDGAYLVRSVPEAIELLEKLSLEDVIETVWIGGGAALYKDFMSRPECDRIYLTKVDATYECDTFFPTMPDDFVEINDPDVPQEVQEENGLKYTYHVYQRH